MSPARLVSLVAALAIACHGALAQTVVPPTVTVQRIAPQLVGFAGSPANFQSLVNGLSQGTPVQLVTRAARRLHPGRHLHAHRGDWRRSRSRRCSKPRASS